MMSQQLPQLPIYNPTPIPTSTLLSHPQYQLYSNKIFIPANTTQQSLSPIHYIPTQGKFSINQSPEVGQESDEDEISNLNISAKPFNPNKKCSTTCSLASISETEQSDHSDDDTIDIIDTSSNISFTQSPTPIINNLMSYNQVNTIIQGAYTYYSNNLNTFPNPISFSTPNPCISSMTSTPMIPASNSVPNQISFMPDSQVDKQKICTQFVPKFNNHAKGNFYISKEKISEMVSLCLETFHTNVMNDEKLAFGYFKESVAMQINDKQIHTIKTNTGDIIIINIDLQYKNGDNMYLIAMENDSEHKTKVQWKITEFMSGDNIYNIYGIKSRDLPKSSRNTDHFRRGLNHAPVDVDISVIYNTNFSTLPTKKSKRNEINSNLKISESDLKYYCEQSWNNGIMIPVVVIKGKRQWIEWKKFVCIYDYDRNCYEQWIGISLRYYESIKQWKIECLDYDAGRIFYQYRLIGENNIDKKYTINYKQLDSYITTSLCFPSKRHNKGYKSYKSYNKRNRY